MSNVYYVTADNINKKTRQYLNKVIKFLKDRGHTAINGGIGPNEVQNHGLKKSSKGQIGIQIVGGRCGWTSSDCVQGLKKGYYHYDRFIFCGCKDFHTGTKITAKDMDTKMYRAHDAGYSLKSMYEGKTPNQFNKDYGDYFTWILTDLFKDMCEQIVGGVSDSQTSGGTDGKNGSGTSTPTYKNVIDSIKDLIAPLDGEVEVKIRGDTVFINKIPAPKPDLFIKEGVNMVHGTINLKDYNPDTINTLTTSIKNKTFTLVDDYLVNRFGVHEKNVKALKVVTKYTGGEEAVKTNNDKSTETSKQTDDTTKKTVTYAETPILTEAEAEDFLYREWYKIRREDGHQLELKVLGNNLFNSGEWCKVFIPSFSENNAMYITKAQHSAGAGEEWLTNLTLIDYPPSLSKPTQEKQEETKEEDNKVPEDTGGDKETSKNSKTIKSDNTKTQKSSSTTSQSKTKTSLNKKRQLLG